LIDEEGQMLGIMSSGQALAIAREKGLDLVEVSPMAMPPVCKLMDYGRFKYEQAKKENEARKNTKTSEVKEIRMKPHTDIHDLMVKVRKIEEFLGDGDKVKVGVLFRGRELAHPELGRQLLERVIAELKGIATIERPPIMEGKMMSMMVSRAPGWEPSKRTTATAQDKASPAKTSPTPPAASNGTAVVDGESDGAAAHAGEANGSAPLVTQAPATPPSEAGSIAGQPS
jgi:translation initiation factor IF-3